MAICPVTQHVWKDEKALRLAEWNMIRPPVMQLHRWQVLFVNRADVIAEFWLDLGPAENFKAPELNIPSLWEHSVAELQEIATIERIGDDYWQRFAAERQEASTLIPDFLNQKEEHWKVINNQSVYGPGVRKQRNGFSKKAAYEREGKA